MSRQRTTRLPQRLFIDSSAFYAIVDTSDSNHTHAAAIANRIAASTTQLYITNFIRAEAHALLLNRVGHYHADRFLHDVANNPSLTVVYATPNDETQALALIEQYKDKDFSLTDAISFLIMQRLRITHAFAFDRNFIQYGFTML
jgi:predicted nucleic acid-binding protein